MCPQDEIGNDEDMAGVAIYLAARSGNYVVGETIAVDGGVVHAFLTESWEVDPAGGHWIQHPTHKKRATSSLFYYPPDPPVSRSEAPTWVGDFTVALLTICRQEAQRR